jgi:hypothetical protein
MSVSAKDIYTLLDRSDKHARAMVAIHTELRSLLAQVQFPKPDDGFACSCGNSYPTERARALHRANVHGGPAVPLDAVEAKG